MKNSNTKAVVVVPVIKSFFDEFEKISFEQCKKKLSNYKIVLLMPHRVEIKDDLSNIDCDIVRVQNKWMESIDAYSRMLCSLEFYRIFEEYTYMLICQLDAYVFNDRLQEFCDSGYDYIGAPWYEGFTVYEDGVKKRLHVGNGGFSLRNITACINILENNTYKYYGEPEDLFWARCNSEYFKVAPYDYAVKFSFEGQVRKHYEMNGNQVPFGCHAWMKMDYDFFKMLASGDGYTFPDRLKGNWDEKKISVDCEAYLYLDSSTIKNKLEKINLSKPVYLWGTGWLGRKCYNILDKAEVKNIYFMDSDEEKVGEIVNGIEIISSDEIKRISVGTVILSFLSMDNEWKEDLQKQYKNIDIISWKEFLDLLC